MKRVWIILWFIAVLSHNCERSPAVEEQTSRAVSSSNTGKLVCLGDGFTAGVGVKADEAYPAVLQALMAANGHGIKVVNAGIKGETVQMANERVEWILQQRLSAMLFALGCQEIQSQSPPEQVQATWSSLLSKVRTAYPEIPIFITTPCREAGIFTEPAYYASLMEQFDIRFIPLRINTTEEWWLLDADYLNAKGHTVLAKQLLGAVEPVMTSIQ
ncbi:MAG: GDSL-type esterase/lipase family protein [Bacteroidota bacterium]